MPAELEMLATSMLCGLVVSGCAIDLDEPPLSEPAPSPPRLEICTPLPDVAPDYAGRLDSIAEGGGVLVTTGSSLDGSMPNAGYIVTGDACDLGARVVRSRPLLDGTQLGADVVLQPQALVRAGSALYSFFEAQRPNEAEPFGIESVGRGVATWDGGTEQFIDPVLLWTGDRPSFGTGVLADETYVYAYGGRNEGFLSGNAYVARAPLDRLTAVGAWEYWSGGGNWSTLADEAWPLFEASGVVSVAFEPGTERFIAAYSTPLSPEITLRSGLGPDGPWSGPHVVATCNLPASDPGAFCADVVLHPALAYPGQLVLTHGVGSFDRPEGTAPEEIRARLATFPVPSSLP